MFAAFLTIFTKFELLRRVEFTALGQVILTFTHGANKPHNQSLFLLSHRILVYLITDELPRENLRGDYR